MGDVCEGAGDLFRGYYQTISLVPLGDLVGLVGFFLLKSDIVDESFEGWFFSRASGEQGVEEKGWCGWSELLSFFKRSLVGCGYICC